jgi:hypothetical protein
VLVQVQRVNMQAYESYTAATSDEAATELVLPWVAPSAPGVVDSRIILLNANPEPAEATVAFVPGGTLTATLAPNGAVMLPVPAASGPGSARIFSDARLVAVTRMEASGENAGALSLPAFAVPQLTRFMAVPLLYSDHEGWSHLPPEGAVRVYNASDVVAAVTLSYQPAVSGTASLDDTPAATVYTLFLGPREHTDDYPPPPGFPRWALQVASTQPVAVSVIGYKAVGSADRWLAYRGEAYDFFEPGAFLPVICVNCQQAP